MRWKPWLLVLAAIGLSSFTTARATTRTSSNARVQTVRTFYASLIDEISRAGYDDAEQSLLAHPHDYYGRYLDPNSRDYVALTVMPRIADAIAYFDLEQNPRQRILSMRLWLGALLARTPGEGTGLPDRHHDENRGGRGAEGQRRQGHGEWNERGQQPQSDEV